MTETQATTTEEPAWRSLDDSHETALQNLLETDVAFFINSFGNPPGRGAAENFYAVPGGLPAERKLLLGAFDAAGSLIAFADVLRGWPVPETWMVGMFFVRPDARGHGLSDVLWRQLEEIAHNAGAAHLRAAPAVNQPHGLAFLRRVGMAEVESATRQVAGSVLDLVVMEKSVQREG